MAQQPGPSKRLRLQSATTAQYPSSGLKRSFHGVVYQFKLLMLFLHRAMKNGYKFNLATEMDAADKFDDVVLAYEENKHNIYRFLQAKHKQEECKLETKTVNNKKTKIETPVKITTKDLLEGPLDGEFYLPKYFISYRKIMKSKDFNSVENKVLDLILCTNIDLNCEELKDRGIETEEITRADPIMDVSKRNKQPKRYKLSALDKSNDLYEKLRQTSDLHRLANELIAYLENNKIATLANKLFEQYHVALMKKVLEPSGAKACCKFRNSFFAKKIKDQDQLKFREAMKTCLGITGDAEFKKQLEKKRLQVSSAFAKIDNSYTQLGDDHVDDKEIDDFFDKLVLAVDQPNESELGQIINEEIGSEFNLIQADFVTDNFQAEVLDWLKTKDGIYLSNDDAEKFFEGLRAKLFELVLIGPSAIFSSKLSSYDVSYGNEDATLKKIEHFLKSNIQVLNIKTKQPRLGSLKVNEKLTQIADFKKDDAFVFISSKFLLSMRKQLSTAFKANSKSLLVIECSESLRAEHFQLLNEILSNPLKKLIMVARESVKTKFKQSFDEVIDEWSSFQFLTLESQNKILRSKVIFQGVELKLDGIVGATPEIDADTLLQLLNGVTMTIGRDVKHHDFDPDYYIPRFYFRHVEIQAKIEEEFIRRGFLDAICFNEETFENLHGNAHFLLKKYGTLVWKKSKGKVTRLVPYQKKDKNINKYSSLFRNEGCYEMDLIKEKVVVIADSAGMGKSSSLSSLELQLKKHDPSFWVLRIDLNDYTTVFQNRLEGFQEIASFLSDNVLNLRGFEAELFKARLVEKDRMVFLLDGFDEISPDYKKPVLQMITTLLEYSTQIFVTSRLNTSDAVEETLGVFSHRIRPFTKDEQHKYLCKHWNGNAGAPSERCVIYVDAIIEKLADSISDREREFTGVPLQMRMVRDIFHRSELGKWQGYTDFVAANEEAPQLPAKLDVMFLYEKFFWEKFSVISIEKKRDDSSKVGVREDNETLFRNLVLEHQSAALYSLLNEQAVTELLSRKEISKMKKFLKEIEEEKKNRGIIDLIIDNKPRFVHRTFMEYLIADFFFTALMFDCSDEVLHQFVFCRILLQREYGVIRRFMDNMFLKLLNNLDADFPNVFTLKSDYDGKVGDIFEEARTELSPKIAKMWENQRESCIGDRNTTVFHVMVEEENFNLLRFFVECMDDETIKTMADVRRDYDDGSLLYMLANKQNVELIENILSKHVDVDSIDKTGKTVLTLAIRECFQPAVIETLIKFGAKVNNVGDDGRCDIHNAAEKGNLDVVKALLDANCVINVTDDYQITVLHYAVYSGNVALVKLIGSKVDQVDARDENGYSALHYAAYAGNLGMCQWLAERIDVEVRANDGSCILHEAAISGNLDLFRFLVEEKGLAVGVTDQANRTPLHEAAKYDNINIVKYIIEEKSFNCLEITDADGQTLFHEGAKYGSEELLNYLFDKGLKIDDTDNAGKTLLHIAALYGNLEAVKWLSTQNGIDAKSKDNNGCTVIQSVCEKGDEDKKWAIQRNSRVSRKVYPDGIERTDGWSSVPDDSAKIIGLLVNQYGVDVNEETTDGGTALHWAVANGDAYIVEALIKNGANSSVVDGSGTSAFELAWENAFVEKLQVMINSDNITSKNQDGQGLLHWAVEKDDVDFLRKLVLVADVDFSLLDRNGKTALDLADDLEHFECQVILRIYHESENENT